MYLEITLETATDKHLSSALVVNVIFVILFGVFFMCSNLYMRIIVYIYMYFNSVSATNHTKETIFTAMFPSAFLIR